MSASGKSGTGLRLWWTGTLLGGFALAVGSTSRSWLVAVGLPSGALTLHVGLPWEWPWTHRIPGRWALGFVAVSWTPEEAA